MSFTEGFYGSNPISFFGVNHTHIQYTSDVAYAFDEASFSILPRIIFGPPIVTILAVSGAKVGRVFGCDFVYVDFAFNRPVNHWVVKANSHTPFDGDLLDSWYPSEETGFGETYFGSSPFGQPSLIATATRARAKVHSTTMREGRNEVTVYGHSSDGYWTLKTT